MTQTQKGFAVNSPYVESITGAGGIPICLPLGVEKESDTLFEVLDGLLLTGGVDVHPHFYKEEPHQELGEVMLQRDQFEIALTHHALNQGIPILAICRGLQILNVALGGTLYQDIYTQCKGTVILHSQKAERSVATHFVDIEEKSKLYEIVGKKRIAVNSMHHQSIKEVGNYINVVAKARDGIIEAAEMDETIHPYCLAVQWHPEEMAVMEDEPAKKLFSSFVNATLEYKNKR